jgi:hypothetical protein
VITVMLGVQIALLLTWRTASGPGRRRRGG